MNDDAIDLKDDLATKELCSRYIDALDDMNVLTKRMKSCIGAIKRSNSQWAKVHWTRVMRKLHDKYIDKNKERSIKQVRVLH